MNKFRKEFFEKSEPKHDKLMMESLRTENLKKIIKESDNEDDEATVYVCDCDEVEWCNRDVRTVWKNVFVPSCYETSYGQVSEKCEYLDVEFVRKNIEDLEKRKDVAKPIKGKLTGTREITNTEYETEKICKTSNDFLVGYADIFIKYVINRKLDLCINKNWIWDNFITGEATRSLVIEVKPELNDFGNVLRQLKTYMDNLDVYNGCIVTYSNVPQEIKDILNNEGVSVVSLEKENNETSLNKFTKNKEG